MCDRLARLAKAEVKFESEESSSSSTEPCSSPEDATQDGRSPRNRVMLNIYDVSRREAVRVMNAVLAHWLAPVKLGGAFHVAVEVFGMEWSYGRTFRDSRPGVVGLPPRRDPNHTFRQTVHLGCTPLSMEAVTKLISELIEDYPGRSYDVLRRNCCHFADDFCKRLSVSPIPNWVHRLARFGAGVDETLQAVFGDQGVVSRNASCVASLASVSVASGENELKTDEGEDLGPTWHRQDCPGTIAPL